MNKNEITEFFAYLDELRESGSINMWGAGPLLEDTFSLNRAEARKVHLAWMTSFDPSKSAAERAASVELA